MKRINQTKRKRALKANKQKSMSLFKKKALGISQISDTIRPTSKAIYSNCAQPNSI